MASDLETLVEYGFDKEKAALALKKAGGLQGALDWLDANQDKSVEELTAASTAEAEEADKNAEPPALQPGEVAQSLKCDVCGKKFRSQAQANFHASKTEHVDFSESTEEIAPLTEEEKKARLEELRAKLAEKRSGQSEADKEEKKKNEAIRRKSTKETQDIKEDLAKKEQIKEAAAKRKEKQAEIAAKERIRLKIKADQEERRLKAAKDKAEREGRAPPPEAKTEATPVPAGQVTSKPASAYTEARLRLQTSNGTIQKTLPANTTLSEVAAMLESESGISVQSFTVNFPKKIYNAGTDFGQTLQEAGFVPSAALLVK